MQELADKILVKFHGILIQKGNEIMDLNVEISNIERFLSSLKEYDISLPDDISFLKEIFPCDVLKFEEAISILRHFRDDSDFQIIESKKIYSETIKNGIDFLKQKKVSLELLKIEYEKEKNDYKRFQPILKNIANNLLSQTDIEQLGVYLYRNNISKEDIMSIIYPFHFQKEEKQRTILPTLDRDEIEKIKQYIDEYNSLSLNNQNVIISAASLIVQNDFDHLENISPEFSKNEIIYYSLIYLTSVFFSKYQADLRDDNLESIKNDPELLEVVELELRDIVRCIRNNLQKIEDSEKRIENDEQEEKPRNLNNQNLVVFLNASEMDNNGNLITNDVTSFDIEKIRAKTDGNLENDMNSIVRLMNMRLLSIPSTELRKMGANINKPLSNSIGKEYPMFDIFNVYSVKGRVHNPARITYLTLPVSESNQHEIMERYHLPKGFNIYLILGIFTKKNDDSEYVRITHNRLLHEEKQIKELQRIFSVDFKEAERAKAYSLLDSGLLILDDLDEKCHIRGQVR